MVQTVGATTPSTGKFTEVRINSASPALFLDDTDGNELFKISPPRRSKLCKLLRKRF